MDRMDSARDTAARNGVCGDDEPHESPVRSAVGSIAYRTVVRDATCVRVTARCARDSGASASCADAMTGASCSTRMGAVRDSPWTRSRRSCSTITIQACGC